MVETKKVETVAVAVTVEVASGPSKVNFSVTVAVETTSVILCRGLLAGAIVVTVTVLVPAY